MVMNNWREERKLARKTNNPNEFLDNPNFLVRDGLLLNPNISNDILEKLSHDKSVSIREKLARQFIETSTKDSDWRVRYAAINNNPKVPIEILEELIHDKDARVRDEAERLLQIQKDYIYREDFDNAITIKLVIPGACNANCSFCYNKHSNQMEKSNIELKQKWLDTFLLSLEQVVLKVMISIL